MVVVPDNLKAAVVRAAFGAGESPALHRSYRELARHYGGRIDPTPPCSPQKKGRVESGVGYLRHNLLPTQQSRDVGDVADQLRRWTEQTANQRIHGTTGRRPAEAFETDERATPINGTPDNKPDGSFDSAQWDRTNPSTAGSLRSNPDDRRCE